MTSLKVSLSQLILCVLLVATGTNGKPPSAIIGGNTAEDHEFPYQIALLKDDQLHCGGSIIDEKHILTAAHCVGDGSKRLTVVTSTNSLKSGGKRYDIKSITTHPKYAGGAKNSWRNDISVITLKSAINLGSQAKAVKLPTKNVAAGEQAIASGWGRLYAGGPIPDDLRKLEMKTLTTDECKKAKIGTIYETHVCAFAKEGSGVCNGDSGGPLVHNGELIGITSWIIPCGKGHPDVFTRVYSYVDWIKQAIQN